MDSFNKIISFVLGLVVVLVFLAVITGKLNLKSKPFSGSSPTPTPTPTQKPSTVTITGISGNNLYKQNGQIPKSIPSTGLPTLFIPMLLSGLIGGNFLRKTDKK